MSNLQYPVYIVNTATGVLVAHVFRKLDAMVSHHQGRYQKYYLAKSMRDTGEERALLFSPSEYMDMQFDKLNKEEELFTTDEPWTAIEWFRENMQFRNGLFLDYRVKTSFEILQKKVYRRTGSFFGHPIHTVSAMDETMRFICITEGMRTFTSGFNKWHIPMAPTRYGIPVHTYWEISPSGGKKLCSRKFTLTGDELDIILNSRKQKIPKNTFTLCIWRFINRITRTNANENIEGPNKE